MKEREKKMCYSQPLSAALAASGWGAVVWLSMVGSDRRRADPVPPLVGPLAFYALMETLQTIQYGVLDQCGTDVNYALTVMAHVLVVVQPCMWNLYRLAKARALVREAVGRGDAPTVAAAHRAMAVFGAAAGMSVVWALFFTARLLPTDVMPASRVATYGNLRADEIMVGPTVCTFGGPTHLAWTLPYEAKNGLEANLFTYLLLWFYPAIYEPRGAIKLTCWMAQVVLVNLTAGSIHELPTTWCALSVPILLLAFATDYCDRTAAVCARIWTAGATLWRALTTSRKSAQ